MGADAAAEDRSTRWIDEITVFIDGVAHGTVNYNHERSDIEALFPGYRNTDGTNGAIGFRVIDTTRLTNGLHTISWTVVDDQGATEGIGSRFFTVSNGTSTLTAAEVVASAGATADAKAIGAAPRADTPMLARVAWDPAAPWQWHGGEHAEPAMPAAERKWIASKRASKAAAANATRDTYTWQSTGGTAKPARNWTPKRDGSRGRPARDSWARTAWCSCGGPDRARWRATTCG